jgi:hypothetical protein
LYTSGCASMIVCDRGLYLQAPQTSSNHKHWSKGVSACRTLECGTAPSCYPQLASSDAAKNRCHSIDAESQYQQALLNDLVVRTAEWPHRPGPVQIPHSGHLHRSDKSNSHVQASVASPTPSSRLHRSHPSDSPLDTIPTGQDSPNFPPQGALGAARSEVVRKLLPSPAVYSQPA